MELINVGENTYYISNNTNIGIYKINDNEVYLIDSGIDKDTGKKIIKIINDNNWTIRGIINTHSNADHIGGNKVIQERTGCSIFGYGLENAFTENTILEPSFLYGGYPFKELRNKFLMANSVDNVLDISKNLPDGLTFFPLKGHFFDMIGIKTKDNVCFLGDSLASEETINKYQIFFIYDVCEYLKTINFLRELDGDLFILSHDKPTKNIQRLIKLNEDKIYDIEKTLLMICHDKKKFDDILKEVFDIYDIVLNANQYVLIGSTIRSYLSWMMDNDKLEIIIENNYLYFKTKN